MVYRIDIVSKIAENIFQFKKAERKVAQAILDDLVFASSANITEIAQKAEVSEATVTRLAKTLNCKNVRDLRLQIVQAVAVGERFINEIKTAPSGINSVYESIRQSLELNTGLIQQSALDACVELIGSAKQVITMGVGGTSTFMAIESQYRLFRLGFPATAYSDPMLMRMVASTINKDDVIICFSLGGFSPDVKEAMEIAAQYGASIISITAQESELAKISNVNLPIIVRESDYIYKPSASRYVALAAIDVLMTELAVKNKRRSREKLRRVKQTLDQYRQGNDTLPLGD